MASVAAWQVHRRRDPQPGESLSGFIARVAAGEGLPNTLELTRLGGAVWSARPELSRGSGDLSEVAACLRLEVGTLDELTYPVDPDDEGRRLYFGESIDRRMIMHGERRFSPETLAGKGVHLATWQLVPFPFCEKSGEVLHALCPDPDCGAVQRWYHAAGVEFCDQCGESLVEAVHDRLSGRQLDRLRLALGLVHPDRDRRRGSAARLPLRLRQLKPGVLLDLLVAIAGVHSPGIRSRNEPRTLRRGVRPAVVLDAVSAAWDVMSGWPDAFETMAAERIAARTGQRGDGNRGATMDFLDLATDHAAPEELRELVAEQRNRMAEEAPRRGITGREAALLPHLRPTRLAKLRRSCSIPTIFGLCDGAPVPLLSIPEVLSLSEAFRGSASVVKAAAAFGLPAYGVEQLAALGRLRFEDHPGTIDGDGARRVSRRSMEEMISRVQWGAVQPGTNWVPLLRLADRIGGRLKPWAPILSDLLDGKVRFALLDGEDAIAHRIIVDPASSPRITEAVFVSPDGFRNLDRLSKQDALEVLNLHHKYGRAELGRWPSGRSKAPSVPLGELLEVAKSSISLGEIAARIGGCGVDAVALLKRAGVERRGPWSCREEVEAKLFGRMVEAADSARKT